MLEMFVALAEPNRLRIVELLRAGPLAVGEISKRLRLRQPQVSKHLQTLKEAGLVEAVPMAQRRVYELRRWSFEKVRRWLLEPPALCPKPVDVAAIVAGANERAPRRAR